RSRCRSPSCSPRWTASFERSHAQTCTRWFRARSTFLVPSWSFARCLRSEPESAGRTSSSAEQNPGKFFRPFLVFSSSATAASCVWTSPALSPRCGSHVTPLANLLQAALFASARPLATEELAILEPDASPAELQAALDELREHYDVDGHGVELQEL